MDDAAVPRCTGSCLHCLLRGGVGSDRFGPMSCDVFHLHVGPASALGHQRGRLCRTPVLPLLFLPPGRVGSADRNLHLRSPAGDVVRQQFSLGDYQSRGGRPDCSMADAFPRGRLSQRRCRHPCVAPHPRWPWIRQILDPETETGGEMETSEGEVAGRRQTRTERSEMARYPAHLDRSKVIPHRRMISIVLSDPS